MGNASGKHDDAHSGHYGHGGQSAAASAGTGAGASAALVPEPPLEDIFAQMRTEVRWSPIVLRASRQQSLIFDAPL